MTQAKANNGTMTRPRVNTEDHIFQRIAFNIRAQRKNRGSSIAEVAEKLGVTYQQMQKYEIGKNRVSADSLYRIAQALNVDVAVFYKEPEPTKEPYDARTQKLMDVYSQISDKRLKDEIYKVITNLRDDKPTKKKASN